MHKKEVTKELSNYLTMLKWMQYTISGSEIESLDHLVHTAFGGQTPKAEEAEIDRFLDKGDSHYDELLVHMKARKTPALDSLKNEQEVDIFFHLFDRTFAKYLNLRDLIRDDLSMLSGPIHQLMDSIHSIDQKYGTGQVGLVKKARKSA